MWSDPDWFIKRTHADDYQASLEQVEELLAAHALLKQEASPGATKLIYVGHDFGAMYGVLLGVLAPDLGAFILIAGTPRFSDWYFYYPPLSEPGRTSYLARMKAVDPISNIADLHPRPVYFQFGLDDPHVPQDRARAFADAAREPKQVGWYGGGHALDSKARKDRLGWIQDKLKV
jgi:pimeloyl-ACP methyl ester carboxylesterase